MIQYTVFGFYTDTGLKYSSHQEQDSPEDCIQRIKDLYPDDSITIVAIVDGHHSDVSGDGDYIEDTSDWDASRETSGDQNTDIA